MKLHMVDSFTNKPFAGNPAGVWIGDTFPDNALMQALAAELNASETAFVACGEEERRIRYFTPSREVPLCGHATLAAAHLLWELGHVGNDSPFMLRATEADLPVVVKDGWVSMTFPVFPLAPFPAFPDEILGLKVTEAFRSPNNWVVARMPDEQSLRALSPSLEKLHEHGLALVAATARSVEPDVDYVTRVFCHPEYGMGKTR